MRAGVCVFGGKGGVAFPPGWSSLLCLWDCPEAMPSGWGEEGPNAQGPDGDPAGEEGLQPPGERSVGGQCGSPLAPL